MFGSCLGDQIPVSDLWGRRESLLLSLRDRRSQRRASNWSTPLPLHSRSRSASSGLGAGTSNAGVQTPSGAAPWATNTIKDTVANRPRRRRRRIEGVDHRRDAAAYAPGLFDSGFRNRTEIVLESTSCNQRRHVRFMRLVEGQKIEGLLPTFGGLYANWLTVLPVRGTDLSRWAFHRPGRPGLWSASRHGTRAVVRRRAV